MAAQQSHTFASRTSRHTSQSLQKSVPAPTQKEFKNIFPSLLKKSKTLHTQPNDKQMTVAMQTPRPLTVKRFNYSVDRRSACNSGFKKLAVQWLNEVQFSNGTFVVADSLVLRNPLLRKAANRQQQYKTYSK
jgi:hypothetical protein